MTAPTDPAEPMPRRPLEPTERERLLHRRALIARNLAIALAVVLAFGLIGVGTWTVVSIRDAQVENTHARQSSDQTLRAIRSCTTPGRHCFVRAQARTAKAVGDIGAGNRAAAASAAACAAQIPHPTYRLVLACMNKTLEHRPSGP